MAATQEDGDPETFSPSIFLDLPPTPRGDGDDPASLSGDLVALPFISRVLMEEDGIYDSLLYQYPDDHPALLTVQQTFAEILSDAAMQALSSDASTVSADATATGGQLNDLSQAQLVQSPPFSEVGDEDSMLKLAFLKGMEEASKLLPTTNGGLVVGGNNKQLPGFATSTGHVKKQGGNNRRQGDDEDDTAAATATATGRRKTKLMVLVPKMDGSGADGVKVDQMVINDFNSCLGKMERLHITMVGGEAEKNTVAKPAHVEAGDLPTLLLHCAQAIGANDRRSAAQLLGRIKKHSSPWGDNNQRLAHWFAQGLHARLAGTGPQVYTSSRSSTSVLEHLEAYRLYLQACCFRMTCFTFSNRSIFRTMVAAGRKKVHVVDYGIDYGWQWPALLSRFATMVGGPPEVRITGVDLPQPGLWPYSRLEETGRRLSSCARHLGVPFKFHCIVAARWETVRAEDLGIDPDELLIVNSLGAFGNLMDEGVDLDSPSPRDAVLANIRNIRPDLFILCTVNGSYSSPFFVARFREALSYYTAMFDMLDATIPRDNRQRLLVERDLCGRCALNAVACEGVDRVERPEAYRQWQVRNRRAGLRQLPLNPVIVQYLKERVRSLYHREFFIDTDHQWLIEGWKGRILYAMSTWAPTT